MDAHAVFHSHTNYSRMRDEFTLPRSRGVATALLGGGWPPKGLSRRSGRRDTAV
jgi:hypothetical protein